MGHSMGLRAGSYATMGGRGVGMVHGCVAVSSWRRLLVSRHLLLPFPGTLSLCRQQCPSASYHLMPSLSLPGLS